jgi:NAD(P)-dependent dehydrogenase (short-subunit alcohol dehydrogenase family)
MNGRLAGRVCVVTGATGMAAASALRLGAEGAGIFVISRKADGAAALADRVSAAGGSAGFHPADLQDEKATEAAFVACVEHYGRIDGLFAVAGGSARRAGDGPVHEAPREGFSAAYELNAVPAYLAARYAVRQMLGQAPDEHGSRGAILLMSSVLAEHPAELFATHGYAAAKGAINSLTTTMAAHYAAEGVRVNAVAAGLVATPMSERAQADPESVAYASTRQPLAGGLLPAEAAGDLAVFFLSPESRYITGQVVDLDGGWSVTEGGR